MHNNLAGCLQDAWKLTRYPTLPAQVLVHAATGGVGSAALQVCAALGCPVLASAGTPGKRALLRAQGGIAATASSRGINFVDTFGCGAPAGVLHLSASLLVS